MTSMHSIEWQVLICRWVSICSLLHDDDWLLSYGPVSKPTWALHFFGEKNEFARNSISIPGKLAYIQLHVLASLLPHCVSTPEFVSHRSHRLGWQRLQNKRCQYVKRVGNRHLNVSEVTVIISSNGRNGYVISRCYSMTSHYTLCLV